VRATQNKLIVIGKLDIHPNPLPIGGKGRDHWRSDRGTPVTT
jgi:hypothetical protein